MGMFGKLAGGLIGGALLGPVGAGIGASIGGSVGKKKKGSSASTEVPTLTHNVPAQSAGLLTQEPLANSWSGNDFKLGFHPNPATAGLLNAAPQTPVPDPSMSGQMSLPNNMGGLNFNQIIAQMYPQFAGLQSNNGLLGKFGHMGL